MKYLLSCGRYSLGDAIHARWLVVGTMGVVFMGAGCSGGTVVPSTSNVAIEANDNSAFILEMAGVEVAWNGFAAAAASQDYEAMQSFVDVELTDAEFASVAGRFLASVPEIDWTKSVFESDVRVALVSTKGAELGTWSLNTDDTWTLEQRYWKMSNE